MPDGQRGKLVIAECIPGEYQHAAKFFFHHINVLRRQIRHRISISDFFAVQLFYWLEAMVLLKSMPIAVAGVTALVAAAYPVRSKLSAFLRMRMLLIDFILTFYAQHTDLYYPTPALLKPPRCKSTALSSQMTASLLCLSQSQSKYTKVEELFLGKVS